jgi:flagellar biosynthesis/type III secretory pathway protein FliH
MTVAEKLIAKGREEGIEKGLEKGREEGLEKGRVRGEFIGRIRLLEELLHSAPAPTEELLALSKDGLRERCENLQRLYREQRENGGGRH